LILCPYNNKVLIL